MLFRGFSRRGVEFFFRGVVWGSFESLSYEHYLAGFYEGFLRCFFGSLLRGLFESFLWGLFRGYGWGYGLVYGWGGCCVVGWAVGLAGGGTLGGSRCLGGFYVYMCRL